MAPESEHNLRLEIGHTLFIDLVGYSKLLIEEQKERLRQLTDIVLATSQVREATNEKLIRLPTGDGMALVFRNSSEEPACCALEIAQALRAHPEIPVRMGIHSGPVSEVSDVSGRTNIAGAGINMAQRVMDCGEAGHILLSQRVADDLAQYRQWSPRLHDLGECEVKHGVRLDVFNLYTGELGNPEVPEWFKTARQPTPPAQTQSPWRNRSWLIGLGILIIVFSLIAVLLIIFAPALSRSFSLPSVSKTATNPVSTNAVAAMSAPEKSIAVLPFENRSDDKANAYFADGIQDEILTRLAKIADLKVISRTSTQRYKSSPENLPEIAKHLGVAHVLEGSVQKAGEQVRVTVQLIRGASDSHVWAETYDRKLTDIFAVESEIAGTIARSLQAKLTPGEKQAVAAKPTENPYAYEAYLGGLAVWNRLSSVPEDYDEMIRHFSRAVELDPKFALAWSFLSVAHSYQYWAFDPTPQMAGQAKEAFERARNLQPDLGEAYFAEAMYCYKVLRDYDKALVAFQKAREHSANRVMAIEFSAYVKRRQGKWDDALRLHAESLELDPRNPIILSEAALTYRALRRFDEAQALIDRAREIEPANTQLLAQKAEISLAQGDPATARRILKQVVIDGADPAVTMAYVRFHIMVRQYPEAIRTLKSVLEKPEKLPKAFAAITTNYRAELAIADALAGNPEAKAGLERAREGLTPIHAQGGDTNWTEITLLLVAGFLQDKTTVDGVAAQLRDRIENDALSRVSLEEAIAIAHAHLGETEVALKSVKQLLKMPGETSLTPGLLRIDPLWDPLRNDPRFQELANQRPP